MNVRTGTMAIWCAAAAGVVGIMSGCETMVEIAPPVDDVLMGAAADHRPDVLHSGRNLYLTRCVRCHSPEPIRRYSPTEWSEILPRMGKESALSSPEYDALEAYVRSVLTVEDDRDQPRSATATAGS